MLVYCDPAAASIHVMTKGKCHASRPLHGDDYVQHRIDTGLGVRPHKEKVRSTLASWQRIETAIRVDDLHMPYVYTFKTIYGDQYMPFYINMEELAIVNPTSLHFKNGDVAYCDDTRKDMFRLLRPE